MSRSKMSSSPCDGSFCEKPSGAVPLDALLGFPLCLLDELLKSVDLEKREVI